MKAYLWGESLLAGVLGACGLILISRTPLSPAARERAAMKANLRLGFTNAVGIDIHGDRVDAGTNAATKRVVAFLLRSKTLSEDVAFWHEVRERIPQSTGVQLVAYCDDKPCVEVLRDDSQPTTFPVIAYGEVVAEQAVLNADVLGKCVVHNAGRDGATQLVSWRDAGRAPGATAVSLLR